MYSGQVFLSGACLLILIGLYTLVSSAIPRLRIHPDQRRRARIALRYALSLFFLLTLVIVWAEEIRSAALVLSAFAVALVLGSKELLMCLGGWWLKLVGGHFRLGDRIQVGDYTGEVIDYGLMTTTLVETGGAPSSTGHSEGALLTMPNSLLLHSTVRNETRFPAIRQHDIAVLVPNDMHWEEAEAVLSDAAANAWAPVQKELEACAQGEREEREIPVSIRPPRVFVCQHETDRPCLKLRLSAPAHALDSLEDQILRAWLTRSRT